MDIDSVKVRLFKSYTMNVSLKPYDAPVSPVPHNILQAPDKSICTSIYKSNLLGLCYL